MKHALLSLLLLAGVAHAKGVPEKDPVKAPKGKICAWKAKDGLVYRFWIPKKYDPQRGANLTILLHGSGMNEGWGMANNSPPKFRGDDIIISPRGTTRVRNNEEFLGNPKDAKRVRALQKEFEQAFKINATFLYGHSNGSFFAIYYAGQYPEHVQGVVAHASGFWGQSKRGKKHHHQAIVYMHGTQDPVVPYWQSVGGYRVWRDLGYPMVRLRALENWNHWPAEHNGPIRHTSQQLAWCEGMTTTDPERLKWCFEFLADCKQKERTDYNAVYTLAKRIEKTEFAPTGIKRRAAKAAAAIEKLVAAHAKALPTTPTKKWDGKPWIIHLELFARTFADVPQTRDFMRNWTGAMQKHEKQALVHINKYWNSKKPKDAFAAWTKAISVGYLSFRCNDNKALDNLAKWRKEAKKEKIGKKVLKEYDKLVPQYRKAIKDAYRAFDGLNRKCGKF